MRHRRRAFLCVAALASGLLLSRPSTAHAREDDERVNARAELGVEYDNNVHRVEQLPGNHLNVVGSPLARAVVGLTVADRVAETQDVAFSVLGAAKAFTAPAARSENVAVVETAGAWNVNLSPRTRMGAGVTYYEAIQAESPTERALTAERDLIVEARDFRSIVPSLRAAQALSEASTLSLSAGYRLFVYKPLPDYDFHAPVVSAEHRFVHETASGDADWALVSALSVEFRHFSGPRLLSSTPDPSGARQLDQFFTGQLDLARTGRVLMGAGYALQWNRSNSFGASLVRHIGTFRFAASLPLGLYLAARAELVYVSYPDRLPLVMDGGTGQANASIEEETRSELRAELSRDIGAHLQLTARYALYANALGQQGEYRRQTGTLSLVYSTN